MNYNLSDGNNFDYSKINWNNFGTEKTREKTEEKRINFGNTNYKEVIEFEDDIMDADFEFTSIENDDSQGEQNTDIFYPTLPDFDFWESFLNRKLKDKEYEIIHDYLLENDINLQIKSLHYNIILNGIFTIPKLTKNNGNCLFESLSHLGYGKASEIRKNIAALLLLVRYDNYFFPNRNACPEELFIDCNYENIVKDKNTGMVYEYNYDAMIVDLYTNHSWSRLPMQLILMTISRIYEVHIKIFSNKSEYINTVSIWDSDEEDIETIYLGHLNEEHYIPVIKLNEDIAKDDFLMDEFMKNYPRYISAKKNYHKWGKHVSMSMGLYGNNSSNFTNYGLRNENTNETRSVPITNQEIYFDLQQIKDFNDFEVIK